MNIKEELQSGREKIYEYWNLKNNIGIHMPKKDWMEIPYFPDEESQMRFLYLVEQCGLDNFEAWFVAILLLEEMDRTASTCFKEIRKQEGRLALAAIAGWICSAQNVYVYLTSHSISMRFFMEKRTGRLRRRVIDFVLGGEWESAALEDKLCFYYPYQSHGIYIGENPLQQGSTKETVFLCGEAGIGKKSAVLQYESTRNNVVAIIQIGSVQCMEEFDWLLFELILHQAVPCINVQGVLQGITDGAGNEYVSLKSFCMEACHISGRLYLLAEEGGVSAQVCRENLGLQGFREITMEKPVKEQAQELWLYYTQKYGMKENDCLAALASGFSFTPLQIRRAAQWAGEHRDFYDSEQEALYAACDAQLCHNLGKWARKLVCHARWEDLVLPPASKQLLREVCNQVRYRDYVYQNWGMGEKFSYGRSVTALFTGSPGTGKTMAAELLAHELGLPLYKIDLPCVVSKYIGETEKNLKEIFAEGKKAQGILFFDEADVLFSKRIEVREANDKFNNMEAAYLLQRLEEYDGIVLLATNYQQNIDEAFKRRLKYCIEFPFPDSSYRRQLWKQSFPDRLPCADDIDIDFLAEQFAFSGSNIKNCVLKAAFFAAEEQEKVRMAHLLRAVMQEFQKSGKHVTREEFGEYYRCLEEYEEGIYGV